MPKKKLTAKSLKEQAAEFASVESSHDEPALYGVTDGKAVGTYVEHKFREYLQNQFTFEEGSSARGIDFPNLLVDMKVTSIRQPQSSCPFKSARQKIYGLGYSLLVFVYDKSDDAKARTGRLNIVHTIFVSTNRTADFQTTSGLLKIIKNEGNLDDILAFFQERLLPVDDVQAETLASEVLRSPPKLGYLTISNALQWRLQYRRVIEKADSVRGVERIH